MLPADVARCIGWRLPNANAHPLCAQCQRYIPPGDKTARVVMMGRPRVGLTCQFRIAPERSNV